ncbi:hypothetical protein [Nostoc sp. DedQUE09]|uniref:hypothetical protein n=1 Tax=Nostoc sp. DedQUE09 TaxID=3075394 RepID=UPI002AD502F8|nr:hypothetical protein [Nostoc sp. DedQUE09]MDZ7955811.1 hypothetical protein [Nostoc sp. DedQUE09]
MLSKSGGILTQRRSLTRHFHREAIAILQEITRISARYQIEALGVQKPAAGLVNSSYTKFWSSHSLPLTNL